MTEYETASLAVQQSNLVVQQSSLALQKASLALQEAALAAQWASVWVAALVGAAQCGLIAYGLYIMRQAARHRDAMHRETMEALRAEREEHKERHRETMAVLRAEREEQRERHRETMEALRELIRRTSAPSARQDG